MRPSLPQHKRKVDKIDKCPSPLSLAAWSNNKQYGQMRASRYCEEGMRLWMLGSQRMAVEIGRCNNGEGENL